MIVAAETGADSVLWATAEVDPDRRQYGGGGAVAEPYRDSDVAILPAQHGTTKLQRAEEAHWSPHQPWADTAVPSFLRTRMLIDYALRSSRNGAVPRRMRVSRLRRIRFILDWSGTLDGDMPMWWL